MPLVSENVPRATDTVLVPLIPSMLSLRTLDQLTEFIASFVGRRPTCSASSPWSISAGTCIATSSNAYPPSDPTSPPLPSRQEVTIAEAAEQQHVDRSTIMRIRTVANEGALAALAASKPGVHAGERDYELESAKAEAARLSEPVKQMAVKLTLVEGKGGWA